MEPSKKETKAVTSGGIRAERVASGITEHQRIEQALRESQALLNAIVDSTSDMIWSVDSESFNLLTFNRSLSDFNLQQRGIRLQTGMSQEDIISTQDTLGQWRGLYQRALLEGSYTTDYTVSTGSNVLQLTFNLLKRDGKVYGISVFGKDITERKRADELLRESEQRFRTTFENAGVGMALVDMQGHPVKSNSALREMLGYSEEELSRMAFTEFTHPDDRDLDWGLYSELAAGKRDKYEIEKRYLKKGGGVVWGQLIVSLVKDRNGRPIYALGMVQDVTARKLGEEELRLTRYSVEHASDAIFWIDPQGHIVFANEAACRSLGRSREELLSLSIPDIDPLVPKKVWGRFWEEVKGRGSMIFETQHQAKQGRMFPVEVTANYLEFGGKEYSFAFARDITERSRAKEALRASESRYRFLFENNVAAIIRATLDGRIVDCNGPAARILGYESPQELLGLNMRDIHCDPEKRAELIARLQAVRALSGVELRLWHKDGRPLWIVANLTLTVADDKGETFAQGTLIDITERKQAEEALRQSDQRYKDFISHSHEGVWRLEIEPPIPINLPEEEILTRLLQDGYIAECNLAFARNLGFSTPEEIVGLRFRELVSASDKDRLESYRSSIRGGLGSRTVEFRGRDRAGNLRHFLRTEIPIVENGMFVRAWGITRDVTELKQAEEEQQRSLEQLRALAARLQKVREEERTKVAREIHDELGQALTAIMIDVSSLSHELPVDKKQQSESTLKLVEETIQSVRRISTELRPVILDAVGLVAAIEWAGEEFEARTGTKCHLDLPMDKGVIDPECATALFRIFQETLTNVARHANATEINVRMAKEDGKLILEVHDNGKGVSEEQLSSGSSLGILGMRERALLLGGELTITGDPGKGTTVRVRIPETHPTVSKGGQ